MVIFLYMTVSGSRRCRPRTAFLHASLLNLASTRQGVWMSCRERLPNSEAMEASSGVPSNQ